MMSSEVVGSRDDRALLSAIASGDRESFHEFYLRYSGRLIGYLRRLTQSRALAEEVTQEVFVSVWLKAASYQPDRGEPAGWLYAITRNKLVDRWRRGDRSEAVSIEDVMQGLGDHGSTGQMDRLLSLRQALAHLTCDQREMLEMSYFGGLTYEETAQRLRLPVGTLKSRMRAALGTLRTILEG